MGYLAIASENCRPDSTSFLIVVMIFLKPRCSVWSAMPSSAARRLMPFLGGRDARDLRRGAVVALELDPEHHHGVDRREHVVERVGDLADARSAGRDQRCVGGRDHPRRSDAHDPGA